MWKFSFLFVFLSLGWAVNFFSPDRLLFDKWMREHQITYENEEATNSRLKIWLETLRKIKTHNAGSHKWEMGLNQFSAMTWEEFQDKILMDPQTCSATHGLGKKPINVNPQKVAPPTAIDWREAKIVSEVKNQAECGSCWSFSATGALESHHALYDGQLILLSEQNLVDCAGDFNNNGCGGGLPSQAFEYVKYNGGLDSEFSYHYLGRDERCKYSSEAWQNGVQVKDVYNITKYDESEIGVCVGLRGPVSIAYQVASDFQNYKSGIYSSTICQNTTADVNHAVLAVGYNVSSSGEPYWIVKNSWKWTWGMEGYFWIERGVNMCGLASCAAFPIVA